MSTVVNLTGGPAKDDLLRAVTNPHDPFTATFETPQGAIEALIERLEESGADGVSFLLLGSPGVHRTARRGFCGELRHRDAQRPAGARQGGLSRRGAHRYALRRRAIRLARLNGLRSILLLPPARICASASPSAAECLKPCPEQAEANSTLSLPGWRSMTNRPPSTSV